MDEIVVIDIVKCRYWKYGDIGNMVEIVIDCNIQIIYFSEKVILMAYLFDIVFVTN